ncbi:unnamed protein product [Rhizophagus irregularis]|uniref:Uncharacterized protein n=1 Tax=Rhizophagus irregularis TaxID=588596 RepID=A0A916E4Z0_9GLOM|nr:unnamed protein product [Rhizophagus irregularis]
MWHFSSNNRTIKQLKKFVPTDKVPHTVYVIWHIMLDIQTVSRVLPCIVKNSLTSTQTSVTTLQSDVNKMKDFTDINHQILRETPHVVNIKTRPLIKELPTASRRERSNILETLVPIPTPAKIASPPLIPYTPKWFLATGSISQSTYDNYIDKSTNIQNSGACRLKTEKRKAYLSDVRDLLNLHNSVLRTKRLKLLLDFLPVPANALGP